MPGMQKQDKSQSKSRHHTFQIPAVLSEVQAGKQGGRFKNDYEVIIKLS